jgi:hypothetical protein
MRPANFTGLGLFLPKLVDRRDAGRHAVPRPQIARGARAQRWRRHPAAWRGSRATFYVLDVQLVTRTSAAGPAAGAPRRRTGPAGGGAKRRRP